MTRYRLRRASVLAVQWGPGLSVPGVEPVEPMIKFSGSGGYFYIAYADEVPRYWMSVSRQPGLVSAEDRKDVGKAWLQIGDGSAGSYHREALPFRFWDLPSGVVRRLDWSKDADLFADYADQHGWKPGRQIARLQSNGMNVNPGDWVVRSEGGALSVMSAEEFEHTYVAEGSGDD